MSNVISFPPIKSTPKEKNPEDKSQDIDLNQLSLEYHNKFAELPDEQAKEILHQRYNGGRAINAIWYNRTLSLAQKTIFMFLGSDLSFDKEFISQLRYSSISKIAAATAATRTTVVKIIKELVSLQYIKKIEVSKHQQLSKKQANYYCFTNRIFDEYCISLISTIKKDWSIFRPVLVQNKTSTSPESGHKFPVLNSFTNSVSSNTSSTITNLLDSAPPFAEILEPTTIIIFKKEKKEMPEQPKLTLEETLKENEDECTNIHSEALKNDSIDSNRDINRLLNNSLIRTFNEEVLKTHLKVRFYSHSDAKLIFLCLLKHKNCNWRLDENYIRNEFSKIKRENSLFVFQSGMQVSVALNLRDLALYCFRPEQASQNYEIKHKDIAKFRYVLSDDPKVQEINLKEVEERNKVVKQLREQYFPSMVFKE